MAEDLRAAVLALIAQYGDDAAVIATLRAAEEAARGDLEASDFWAAAASSIENGADVAPRA